ncbi:YjjW family glycine radical enzyme activase [Anaerobranca gottschalkii]|uniref:Pyruvate formate lyase activating enzyme n=1 Tax=Anaerobranca gottschalkii DSM 13577 TaxID=1120990 RepID=A0A1I0BRB4_9FIRM|nr:YjjW family glycine radical enzyme activase [Anaerobranca gottschalkii]SET09559.1 pyruvate formate lyase activating enzyme [Anaerobranca gottschalkii DSM 13577]
MDYKGLVTKIIPFSFVDGPGNRMAIFLQGCNFNCGYCHNPETINYCNNCGSCVEVCPSGALTIQNSKVNYSKEKCGDCDMCISHCPHFSTPKARKMATSEVMSEIKGVEPFIQGITISGGECTLQWKFIRELFIKVKEETKLTTFIDSNGYFSQEALFGLLPVTDGFMLDLKGASSAIHQQITGKDNKRVLENIKTVYEKGKLYQLRYVVVPTVNDGEEIEVLAQRIKEIAKDLPLVLIPFRKYGVKGKYKDLSGATIKLLEDIKELLLKRGLTNIDIRSE